MKMKLQFLKLINRQSVEEVLLAERVSFFHGEMGAGKSSIPALIDYCLGGGLTRTPGPSSKSGGATTTKPGRTRSWDG